MELTLMIGYGLFATFTVLGVIMISVLLVSNKKDKNSDVLLPTLPDEEESTTTAGTVRIDRAPRVAAPPVEVKAPPVAKVERLPAPATAAVASPRVRLPEGSNSPLPGLPVAEPSEVTLPAERLPEPQVRTPRPAPVTPVTPPQAPDAPAQPIVRAPSPRVRANTEQPMTRRDMRRSQ